MELSRKTLQVTPPQTGLLTLWEALNQEYPTIFKNTHDLYCKKLRLKKEQPAPRIEIFSLPENTLAFYRQTEVHLEIGGLILNPQHFENFEQFSRKIREKLGQILNQELPPLEELELTNTAFLEIKANTPALKLLEGESQAAQLLLSPKLRTFLREIKQVKRKLLAENTPERKMAAELGDSGLLERQYQIFCRESGQQLMRVESEAFADMVRNQFRCTTCGRPFDKEKVDLWVTLSPLGKKLAQKHYWMAILIREKALELGIAPEKIILTGHSGSFTLFLQPDRHLIMVGVNENSPGASDCYLFSQQQKLFRPDHSVYFALLPVSAKNRRYLYSSSLSGITILEGENDLNRLNQVLSETKRAYILELFSELSAASQVSLAKLIYLVLSSPELRAEISPEIPVSEPPKEEESRPEVGAEIKIEVPVREAEKAEPEAAAVIEELKLPEQPAEEIPAPTPFPPPPLPEAEAPVEKELFPLPARGKISDPLLGEISQNVLSGDWQEVEQILSSNYPETPVVLADNLGLIIVKSNPALEEPDYFAALGVEMAESLGPALSRVNLPKPEAVYLDGDNGYLYSHLIADFYLLLWQNTTALGQELPSPEVSFSLKDLAEVSGVKKVLLISPSGELRDSFSPESTEDFSALENILPALWEQAGQFLEQLNFSPLKKVFLKTARLALMLTYLNENNLLAVFLKSEIDFTKISELEMRARSFSFS